jgi:hypothetical protein
MIVKKYVVYSLSKALDGISNNGLEFDDYSFNLYFKKAFDNLADAEKHIINTMEDYRKRYVGFDTRFVIKTTYVYEDDKIFNYKK